MSTHLSLIRFVIEGTRVAVRLGHGSVEAVPTRGDGAATSGRKFQLFEAHGHPLLRGLAGRSGRSGASDRKHFARQQATVGHRRQLFHLALTAAQVNDQSGAEQQHNDR